MSLKNVKQIHVNNNVANSNYISKWTLNIVKNTTADRLPSVIGLPSRSYRSPTLVPPTLGHYTFFTSSSSCALTITLLFRRISLRSVATGPQSMSVCRVSYFSVSIRCAGVMWFIMLRRRCSLCNKCEQNAIGEETITAENVAELAHSGHFVGRTSTTWKNDQKKTKRATGAPL